MEVEKKMTRWRLILGAETRDRLEKMGAPGLNDNENLMDQALAAIYNQTEEGGFGKAGNGAGKGPSTMRISRWLGDVRTLFDKELVTVIQSDAMERCGLNQMLLEPEILENLEPDIGLAAVLLTLKEQIPKASKESARRFIQKIVEEINKLLEQDIRQSVTAAINKRRHSPIPSAAALDYKRTITRNLKHYSPELGSIVPEQFYFFDRTSTSAANRWTVILDVDQSGSMGESVIYSSIMSCILASMASLKTYIVAFDTNFVDLTEKAEDPVDLLFGFQLGGGTNIDQSVAYCQTLIENPSKTLFFLISDLEEGGNRAALLRKLKEMKESQVTVICLLALADGGSPYYDASMAQKIAAMGIPCFACSPQKLPLLLNLAFRGVPLEPEMFKDKK